MSVFVAIGSNISPERNLPQAVALLDRRARILDLSTIYLSAAEGPAGQPNFLNVVVKVATEMPPRDFKFDVLRTIEAELGRRRSENKYAPRTIDLDLLLYNDLVINAPDLTLPDPEIPARPYLAFPLYELEPGLLVPGLDVALADIVGGMRSKGLRPMDTITRSLKEIYHGRR
jgi:2-amino-4-hydroxy-6-hydroxymethyldihydropteridine diphosphokinase